MDKRRMQKIFGETKDSLFAELQRLTQEPGVNEIEIALELIKMLLELTGEINKFLLYKIKGEVEDE